LTLILFSKFLAYGEILKNKVLFKPHGFNGVLFAKLGEGEYHYTKHNITAKQYNSTIENW